MSPKQYKLTYFNGRGLAETTRLILAQAGVDYEDVRIEKDKWPELKPTMPFGKVPVLEVDGEIISESRAIARFVAKENGLAGKDTLEAAKCDMLVDAFYDLFSNMAKWRQETDEAAKVEMFKFFATETVPPVLKSITTILEKNGGSGYLVGDKVTWADIAVAYGLQGIDQLGPAHGIDVLANFPQLKSLIDRVLNLPNIKAWIDKRPVTDF